MIPLQKKHPRNFEENQQNSDKIREMSGRVEDEGNAYP